MNISFEGKNVLVTGAARGIGRAVALAFAKDGANVLVNTRRQDTLDAIYREVSETASGKTEKFLADVGYPDQINAMCDYMIEKLGGIDILVTNAADTGRWPFLGVTPEILERHVKTNLNGVFFLNQRAAKDMIRRKVPGRIINFSSIGATKPHRMQTPYDTTKGAIESITRSAALELAPFGITVNAVAPACVKRVDTLNIVDSRAKEASLYESPILRWGNRMMWHGLLSSWLRIMPDLSPETLSPLTAVWRSSPAGSPRRMIRLRITSCRSRKIFRTLLTGAKYLRSTFVKVHAGCGAF